jgi:hypothetical protein
MVQRGSLTEEEACLDTVVVNVAGKSLYIYIYIYARVCENITMMGFKITGSKGISATTVISLRFS